MSGLAKKSRKGVRSVKAGRGVPRNTPIALAFGKLTPKVQEAIKAMLFTKILKNPKMTAVSSTTGKTASSRRATDEMIRRIRFRLYCWWHRKEWERKRQAEIAANAEFSRLWTMPLEELRYRAGLLPK